MQIDGLTILDRAAFHAGLVASVCAWCRVVTDVRMVDGAEAAGLSRAVCTECGGLEILNRAARHAELLISICMWCHDVLGAKPSGNTEGGLSHGACPRCVAQFYRKAS